MRHDVCHRCGCEWGRGYSLMDSLELVGQNVQEGVSGDEGVKVWRGTKRKIDQQGGSQ